MFCRKGDYKVSISQEDLDNDDYISMIYAQQGDKLFHEIFKIFSTIYIIYTY
jgi:hypothetical protein